MGSNIFVAEELRHLGLFFTLLPFLLILAVISPILCMVIMKRKGYDPYIWLVLGFFLHIIALFICIIIPRNDIASAPQYGQPYQPPYPPNAPYGMPNQPMPDQMQGVRCQTCGMMNPPGAIFCSDCGNKMV